MYVNDWMNVCLFPSIINFIGNNSVRVNRKQFIVKLQQMFKLVTVSTTVQ